MGEEWHGVRKLDLKTTKGEAQGGDTGKLMDSEKDARNDEDDIYSLTRRIGAR